MMNPNGIVARAITPAWMKIGTISFSARPMSSDDRAIGATSVRSCDPVCISYSRFDPVTPLPNSAIMTSTPGTNQARVSLTGAPEPATSSGPNSPRNTSGCSRLKISENGSRMTGRSSRVKTFQVSRNGATAPGATVVLMRMTSSFLMPLRRQALFAERPSGQPEEHVVQGRLAQRGGDHPIQLADELAAAAARRPAP